LNVVEQISELRDTTINCVFKSKTPCTRKASTLFGLCSSHLQTKKGAELQTKWNTTIDQLAEESVVESIEESEEVTIDKSEEDKSVEEKVDKKVKKEDATSKNVPTPMLSNPDTTEESSEDKNIQPDENDIKKTGPGKYHVPLIKTKTGHWVHKKSGIVFNMNSQKAIGKISDDSKKIYTLEPEDIAFCERYNIEYVSVL